MALARTALRLAAIPTLLADPVVTALCGPRVFDSRIYRLDSAEPVPLPPGDPLLASGPLDDGMLPPDTAVWLA